MSDKSNIRQIGVGPHPIPWPVGQQYDTTLLANGDTRNVEDRYRYWTMDAIHQDMAARAFDLEIAIENWQHDSNIGTIVRTANAFNVSRVHIIGKRHWNRRGAMVTDRYMDIIHHVTIDEFMTAAADRSIVGVDNIGDAVDIGTLTLPKKCVLVFGGEGPGLSPGLLAKCSTVVMIPQYGSTRSINVGVAAGIVMYQWIHQQNVVK